MKPIFVEQVPDDPLTPRRQTPQQQANKVIQGCVSGRKTHSYGVDGECKHCGYKRPFPERKATGTRSSTSSTASRPTSTSPSSTSSTRRVEPAVSRRDTVDGIAFLLLTLQKVAIMRLPELKPDELTPKERLLLADALTDEAFESATIRRMLAKMSQQKKHAKLAFALTVIALPRMKRHGLIPEGLEVEEMASELADQSQARTSAGHGGGSSDGSELGWDAVPVAAGGSPFPDRGNGFGEINVSGLVDETAPIRGDSEDEVGRHQVARPSYRPIPSGDEEPETGSYRAATRSQASGSEEG